MTNSQVYITNHEFFWGFPNRRQNVDQVQGKVAHRLVSLAPSIPPVLLHLI